MVDLLASEKLKMKGETMQNSPYAYDSDLHYYRQFKSKYICVRCELEYIQFEKSCVCCKLSNIQRISDILAELKQKIKITFCKAYSTFPYPEKEVLKFNEVTKEWEVDNVKLREKLRIFLRERDLDD